MIKRIAALLLILAFAITAGCTKSDEPDGDTTVVSDTQPSADGKMAVLDKDGGRIGEIDRRAVCTAVDGGIFYSISDLKEYQFTADTEYRFFDMDGKKDVSLGTLENQGYEASFARTDHNGKIYTLSVVGNATSGDPVPLLLLAFDPAAGTMKKYTVSENGFPYASMTVSDGKLIIMDHEMSEPKCDKIYEFDPGRDNRINQREILLDRVIDQANQYIVSLSPYIKRDRDNRNSNFQIKALICFERIGDLAVNIKDEVADLRDGGKELTDYAKAELKIAVDSIYDILDLTIRAYKENDNGLARRVEPLEEVIDDLIDDLNSRHVYRMMRNICDPVVGIRYQSILQNLEHISDQCSDLAIYIIELTDMDVIGNEHDYIHNLHHSNNADYQRSFRENYQKYFTLLENLPFTKEGVPRD